ncbi:MAG: hypothetical protein IPK63_17505 [Candidatus Competibacteraceae bacterium]|nr:hypothetical protein [Candidatus Competibacteraceae bacterium]
MSESLAFDRVLVIERGRLVEDGAPDQLAQCPNPRYWVFLATVETVKRRS